MCVCTHTIIYAQAWYIAPYFIFFSQIHICTFLTYDMWAPSISMCIMMEY